MTHKNHNHMLYMAIYLTNRVSTILSLDFGIYQSVLIKCLLWKLSARFLQRSTSAVYFSCPSYITFNKYQLTVVQP